MSTYNGSGWESDQETQPLARSSDLPDTGELSHEPTAKLEHRSVIDVKTKKDKVKISSEDDKSAFMHRQRRRREFMVKCDTVQKAAITTAIVWVSIVVIIMSTWVVMYVYGGGKS